MDPTTTKCAYIRTEIGIRIHLSQGVLYHGTSTAHATPDADGDPEVDTDNSVPTIMIPHLTSSIDLASHHHKRASKSHLRNSQLQLRDARRHSRLDSPPSKPPHPLFPMDTHAEPFRILALLSTSRVFAPLLLAVVTRIIIDPARLRDACSCHQRYRYPPHPRSRQRSTSRRKP
jgi:hypothetical protein